MNRLINCLSLSLLLLFSILSFDATICSALERRVTTVSGNVIRYSSPVIAEIDGDTTDGKEIAVASADGTLSVVKSDGTVLWSARLPNASCGTSENRVFSSPAVGALFGDGVPYVVIGYGGFGGTACGGGVVAYRGANGTERWRFDAKLFAKRERFGTKSHAVYSTPALGDADGDGKLEIGFGSFDRNVYLLNADGTVRWYYNAADTVWSSGAFADVNKDGRLEFIIGTDISRNSHLRPPTYDGGYVYAFRTNTRRNRHISFRDSSAYVWQTYLDQVVYSSPTIADVISSVAGPEVVIGSGCYFPAGSHAKRGKWVKVLRLANGKVLRTLNTTGCASSSPAVGDLDGDGKLEVVAEANGATNIGGDGSGRVFAWKADSGVLLWSTVPRVRGENDESAADLGSAVVADLDGNGSPEVVVNNGSGVVILNGQTGGYLTCITRSCADTELQLLTDSTLRNTPAVGVLDVQGTPALAVAGRRGSKAALFVWRDFAATLNSPVGAGVAYGAPWPMFRGNSRRSGTGG